MTRNIFTLACLFLIPLLTFSQSTPELMGVTFSGGSSNTGTIFSMTPDGHDFKVRHNFDEVGPYAVHAGLTLASDGKLYGTTNDGGMAKSGSIYRIDMDGNNFEILHSFTIHNGNRPRSAPIEGTDGNLYGTTAYGGENSVGVIYKMDKNGSNFTVLHHFESTDGGQPIGILHESPDGMLYGMANRGGEFDDGTIYRISKDGSGFARLHSFFSVDEGQNPYGGLIEDSEGGLYGNLFSGGPELAGSIFKIQKDGSSFQLIKTFNFDPDDGNQPYGTLLEASDGKFYGTTFSGGSSYVGIIFSMDKDGSDYTMLHEFASLQGRNPFAGNQLVEGSDGALYGTTRRGGTFDYGVVYKINKNGSGFSLLHEFDNEGANPYPGVIASNGRLFGTTFQGGNSDGGIIFSINEDGSAFDKIMDFSKVNENGFAPYDRPILANDSWVYGSTREGGEHGFGTLFRLKTDGTSFETIYQFNGISGAAPSSALLEGSDGIIYGTAAQRGEFNNGTIFKMNPSDGSFSLLHTFSIVGELGALPLAGLIEGSDGTLYGTAQSGGNTGAGTIFRLQKDGSNMEAIYHFVSNGNTGRSPWYTLLEGEDGLLYGITVFGGSTTFGENGTLFKLEKDGSNFEVLKHFNNSENGAPAGSLISNNDGFLYGQTLNGGNNNVGTIYRISTDGLIFETIHHFDVTNGISPLGPLLPTPLDDWLYGVASSGGETDHGVVFRVKPDGSEFEKVYDFKGYPDGGSWPIGGLLWLTPLNSASERPLLEGLTVVPNPTTGPISLTWEKGFPIEKKATLTIVTESGKLIGKIVGDLMQLNNYLKTQRNNWGNGVYFLYLEMEAGYFSEKIIINKG